MIISRYIIYIDTHNSKVPLVLPFLSEHVGLRLYQIQIDKGMTKKLEASASV